MFKEKNENFARNEHVYLLATKLSNEMKRRNEKKIER